MQRWWLAIALIVLGWDLALAQEQAQNCGLQQYDSISMEVYPDHLLLPVTFGTTEEKLVFLMGDAESGINSDFAEKMDMSIRSIPTNIHVHRDGTDITRVAHGDMQLGRQTFKGMEFLMLRSGRYSDGVVGNLGTQLLLRADLELDMAHGKFNLFSQDHCPGKVVYWTKAPFAKLPIKPSKGIEYIRAEVMLDGHPLTVAFGTQGGSRIGMNIMRRFFNIDNSPELIPVAQDLVGHKLYKFPFKALTADALTISNPDILVYDEQPRPECNDKLHFADEPGLAADHPKLTRCFGGLDAVLGLSVLSKLHIYVSGKENFLYLTEAKAD